MQVNDNFPYFLIPWISGKLSWIFHRVSGSRISFSIWKNEPWTGGIGYYDHKAKNVHDYWISVGDTYEERISTKWSCDEFTQDALETLEERQTTGKIQLINPCSSIL